MPCKTMISVPAWWVEAAESLEQREYRVEYPNCDNLSVGRRKEVCNSTVEIYEMRKFKLNTFLILRDG